MYQNWAFCKKFIFDSVKVLHSMLQMIVVPDQAVMVIFFLFKDAFRGRLKASRRVFFFI